MGYHLNTPHEVGVDYHFYHVFCRGFEEFEDATKLIIQIPRVGGIVVYSLFHELIEWYQLTEFRKESKDVV